MFESGFCFDFFGFLIALPFLDRLWREPHEMMESWRIYYHMHSLVFCWGDKSKHVYMPWLSERVQNDVLRRDGTWSPFVGSWEKDKEPDGRALMKFPYRYVLKNGEVQDATATVHVERSRYVWRCVKKLPLFWGLWKWKHFIEVEFDREIGERAGSWKGGCIGCGYDMRPGETPEQTLRRMERERKF